MGRLGLWIAGFVFIAAGLITITSGGSWQMAIIIIAIGVGVLFFLSKG